VRQALNELDNGIRTGNEESVRAAQKRLDAAGEDGAQLVKDARRRAAAEARAAAAPANPAARTTAPVGRSATPPAAATTAAPAEAKPANTAAEAS